MDSVRPARSGPECSPLRYLLLRASRPPSLGAPGVTAAAARQLLLPALLPTPGLGCALACLTEHLHWGDSFRGERTGSGPGPKPRWSHDPNLGRRSGRVGQNPWQLWDPSLHIRLKWALAVSDRSSPRKHSELFQFSG